ncbi:hypothetical protein BDR22DRAFT_823299 [Usnea florida]
MLPHPCRAVSPKPSNWAGINGRITQPRPSLSPSRFSETALETFQQNNEEALTEATVMSKAFPVIAGTADIAWQENLLFAHELTRALSRGVRRQMLFRFLTSAVERSSLYAEEPSVPASCEAQ